MDFVHGGSSGLEIPSLEAVMQELVSFQAYEYDTVSADQHIMLQQTALSEIMVNIIWGGLRPYYTSSYGDSAAADATRRLLSTCKKIKAILDDWDAGERKISGTALETYLDALEGYCYDAEDLVDVLRLGSFRWKKLFKVVKLHLNLERVGRGIESLLVTQGKNHLKQQQQLRIDEPLSSLSDPYYENLLFDQTPLVGRLDDVETIVEELLFEQTRSSGVSIIGMDGLGKTSLARNIGNGVRIREYFNKILSVSVSAHFQMEDIVHNLATKSVRRDHLRGMCTLIILDDVWSVTDEDWERFQYNYLNLCRRNKVLITTRNPKVAAVTDTTAHYLDRMTDKDCKSLIMAKADLSDESQIWASDVEVIARKCQGMPIVAAKFGFKLSRKRSLDERIESIARIKNTNLWELPEFKEVFPSLKLNEPKLPPHVKRCFTYFSMFPPNHQFNKEDLVQFWEAQGFVRPQHQPGWQPTGSQCFDDLVSRSILLPQKSSNEMQPLYELDELHHGFAKLLASKAFLNIDGGTKSFLSSCKNVRHLSLSCKNIDVSPLKKMKECKGIRTFIVIHGSKTCTISPTILHKFKSLRVLDLSHTNISKLPLSQSQLQHLRYLDLSESDIQSLPDPIHSLRALQTLKLQNCKNLKQLPSDFNQLTSLMHLSVNMEALKHVPSNLGMLTNLETLCSYAVPNEGRAIAELKNMNRLREIHISSLQNVSCRTEAEESMLSTKHGLKRLVLEWGSSDFRAKFVLEGLEPHNELKDLTVRNYPCGNFPTWLTSPSRNLVSFHLKNCRGCKVLPSLGQLPLLKILVLDSVADVVIVDERFCGQGKWRFPSLESLEFCNMESLFQWIRLEEGDMPCLHSLKFLNCPRLANLPSLLHQSCLESLKINNCPELESIPELPSTKKGKHVKVIIETPLSKERCQGDDVIDHPETEDIRHTKGSHTTKTGFSSESQPLDKDKKCADFKVQQPEIIPAKPPKQGDEGHMLQGAGDGKAMRAGLNGQSPDSPWPRWRLPLRALSSDQKKEDSVTRYRPWPSDEEKEDSDAGNSVHYRPWPSDEEKEDSDAGNSVHYPTTIASSYKVIQDSSKETPQSTPSATHYLGNVATGLENIDYEKQVDGKEVLFLFGEGIEFEKEMLIELWMALGLLTGEPMEGIGANYFEKLVSDEYILCSEASNCFYKVNAEKLTAEFDMIRDKQNYVVLGNRSHNDAASADTLHASVVCDEIDASIFKTLGGFNKLRTLLFLGNHGSRLQQIPRDLFLCYESLVALDLSGTHIKELPSSAGKLIHLRYLDVSWTFIEVLPQRIDRFGELQTLKLEGCSRLRRLPKEMKLLTALRHLYLDVLRQLAAFPEGMGALEQIRTLSGFPVGTEEGHKIGELKRLNNIRGIWGKFCIAKMENVQSADEAKEASLSAKRNIKKLELKWSNYQPQDPRNEDESILRNLRPHSDLEEIQIVCYPGAHFPDWIADVSFHKLASITLFRCVHAVMLPSLGKLPSLVSLELYGLNSVTNMDCKGAFPRLEKLAVDEMLNVQTWTEAQQGDYKCLVKLSIKDCPNLCALPSLVYLSSLENLEVSGCTELEFALEKELPSSLQQLIVVDCPLIEKRCSKEGGDWHKIKNISNIWIDQVPIQIHKDI